MKIKFGKYEEKTKAIKVIRNNSDLGLKEAKELVESFPTEINSKNFNIFNIAGIMKESNKNGIEVKIVEPTASQNTKEIKKIMRRAFEADNFELLNSLIQGYNFSKKQDEEK